MGETWVSLTGTAQPHGRATVRVYLGAALVAFTVSDNDGHYEVTDLAAGSYSVIGETWINTVRYSGAYYNVVVTEPDATGLIIFMYE